MSMFTSLFQVSLKILKRLEKTFGSLFLSWCKGSENLFHVSTFFFNPFTATGYFDIPPPPVAIIFGNVISHSERRDGSFIVR